MDLSRGLGDVYKRQGLTCCFPIYPKSEVFYHPYLNIISIIDIIFKLVFVSWEVITQLANSLID
jgi:hypothetical protein